MVGRRTLIRCAVVAPVVGVLGLIGVEIAMSDPTPSTIVGSREFFAILTETRHPATQQIMRHFAWSHLPLELQEISRPCGDLALAMLRCPDGPELTAGLRKLLEAKDCFVRAFLDR